MILAAIKSRILSLDQVPPTLLTSINEALIASSHFVKTTLRLFYGNKNSNISDGRQSELRPDNQELRIAHCALRQDRTLAMETLAEGIVPIADLPRCWICDPHFWQQALQFDNSLWKYCPFIDEAFVSNVDPLGVEVMTKMLDNFPGISSNLDVWQRFLKNINMEMERENAFDLHGFMHDYAAPGVLRDKDTVLLAISHDPCIYLELSTILQSQILEALISTRCEAMVEIIPRDMRLACPSLVVQAITSASDEPELISLQLENEEWSNRDILRAWLSIGGWWKEEMPRGITKDEKLMLLAVENNQEWFDLLSPELLESKEFIIQELDKNGFLYRSISSNSLIHDFDVVLTA